MSTPASDPDHDRGSVMSPATTLLAGSATRSTPLTSAPSSPEAFGHRAADEAICAGDEDLAVNKRGCRALIWRSHGSILTTEWVPWLDCRGRALDVRGLSVGLA